MVKKTRLLYVDDEAAWRNIFCREISEDQRYEIKTAADGEEGHGVPCPIFMTHPSNRAQ